jgi:hypothetical protein
MRPRAPDTTSRAAGRRPAADVWNKGWAKDRLELSRFFAHLFSTRRSGLRPPRLVGNLRNLRNLWPAFEHIDAVE